MSDAQSGHFERVGICGDEAPAVASNSLKVCDLPAGHAGWHQAQQSDTSGLPARPMSWTWTQPPTGVDLIAAERRRQVEQEGWTPEHDAEHAGEGLALAACCYAVL